MFYAPKSYKLKFINEKLHLKIFKSFDCISENEFNFFVKFQELVQFYLNESIKMRFLVSLSQVCQKYE